MRVLLIFLLAITSACSGNDITNPYGISSQSNDLANSPLNNNINNTSAIHPYHNIYPSSLTPKADK